MVQSPGDSADAGRLFRLHRDNEVSATASGISGAFLCGAIISRFAIPAAFVGRRPPLGEPVAISRYSSALVQR